MTVKTIRLKKNISLTTVNDREVRLMIILLSILAGGVIIGAGISDINNFEKINIAKIVNNHINNRLESDISKLIISDISLNLSVMLLMLISGLCCIGLPMPIIIILLKSIYTGIIGQYVFTNLSLKLFIYYIFCFLPENIIFTVTILLLANHSILMSNKLYNHIIQKKDNIKISPKEYYNKFIILTIPIILASITESIINYLFFNLLSA